MRQLLDLARENAALKYELTRIRQEAEEIQRLLAVVRPSCSCADRSTETASAPSEDDLVPR